MRLTLAAVVLLCACGAPPPSGPEIVYSPCSPVLVLPEDASAEERASVEAGIALWKEVGLTTLSTSATEAEARVPVRFEDAFAAFHGVYEPASGIVYVNHKLEGSSERAITVAHELGHALGLPHVPKEERTSLMNPGNLTVPPSVEDLDQLRQRWGCPSR